MPVYKDNHCNRIAGRVGKTYGYKGRGKAKAKVEPEPAPAPAPAPKKKLKFKINKPMEEGPRNLIKGFGIKKPVEEAPKKKPKFKINKPKAKGKVYDINIGHGQKSMTIDGMFNPTAGELRIKDPDFFYVSVTTNKAEIARYKANPPGLIKLKKSGNRWKGGNFTIGTGKTGEEDGQGSKINPGDLPGSGGYYGVFGTVNSYLGSFLK